MYWLFKLKLLPYLPTLVAEATAIRKKGVKLPAISEYALLGESQERILILGESTAAGVGASSLNNTLAGNFYRLFGSRYAVANFGKNGITTGEAYSLLKSFAHYQPQKIKGLILFLGANDCFKLTKPSDFQSELSILISSLTTETNPDWIYLADIPPVHLFPAFSAKMKAFLKFQREYLQREMIRLSEKNSKIVFDPITLDLNPEFFSEDQVHPSDLGYEKIAEFALQGLKKRNLFY